MLMPQILQDYTNGFVPDATIPLQISFTAHGDDGTREITGDLLIDISVSLNVITRQLDWEPERYEYAGVVYDCGFSGGERPFSRGFIVGVCEDYMTESFKEKILTRKSFREKIEALKNVHTLR